MSGPRPADEILGYYALGLEQRRLEEDYFPLEHAPLNNAKINISIANERLKMDYKRLHNAKITFGEKYF